MEEKIQTLVGDVAKLEQEITSLQQKETEIQGRITKEEEERKAVSQLMEIQEEIAAHKKEIERINLAVMEVNRDAALEEATGLASEKEKLLAQIQAIDKKGLELQEIFEKNIPKKLIQISFKNFIKMQKQVQDPGTPAFDLQGTRVPGEKTYHMVTDVISMRTFQAHLAAGWQLCEGESIPPPEELTTENSRLVETLATPDIFLNFIMIQPQVLRIPILTPVTKKK